MCLKLAIEKLMQHEDLDAKTCQNAFTEMVSEKCNPLQTAVFLGLLRSKPETAEEISSIVEFLRTKMLRVQSSHATLDIVGTGGDGANTVNISTGSAILAASCGIKVAKHGNRAVSSQAGSADVLEALGLNINLSAEKISQSIDQLGFGFCYSPNFHSTLLTLRNLRKKLNIPTTLNLLGPLLNPANTQYYLLGVLSENLAPIIAQVLQQMGTPRSMVVHGCGLDEISTAGITKILEITPTTITESYLNPEQLGFTLCTVNDLRGGDAMTNAQLLKNSFLGKKGAISDTLILNVAVALNIYGACKSIPEGIQYASDHLYSGSALKLLNNLIEFSHE